MKKLSIIAPVYNEEEIVKKFYEKLTDNVKEYDYEIVFINDGSTDKSLEILKSIYECDKEHVKIISFSRNFGKEPALFAGMKNVSGDYISIIDTDLQQNPKYLSVMYEILDENEQYDVVCMCQTQKKKRRNENLFYKLIAKLSGLEFEPGASDFRTFRKYVKDEMISLGENNRWTKGIFSFVGFNTKYKPYQVEERKGGKSKYNFKNKLKWAVEAIVGYSTKPLRIVTYLGVIASLLSFTYLIVLLIKTLIMGIDLPGYTSTLCAILFLGSIQLLCIGIVGEYLSKTYLETKKRPVYIQKERIGFDDDIL